MSKVKYPKTPKGRVSFASVFHKRRNKQGKDKYELTLLFDEDTDVSELEDAIDTAIEEKWGRKAPPRSKLKIGLKKLDEETAAYDGWEPGMWALRLASVYKPVVLDKERNVISEDEGNSEEFYSGCYARCLYDCYAWETEDGLAKGVSFEVKGIQKLEDGEPFSGAVVLGEEDVSSAFDEDEDEEEEETPRRRRRTARR